MATNQINLLFASALAGRLPIDARRHPVMGRGLSCELALGWWGLPQTSCMHHVGSASGWCEPLEARCTHAPCIHACAMRVPQAGSRRLRGAAGPAAREQRERRAQGAAARRGRERQAQPWRHAAPLQPGACARDLARRANMCNAPGAGVACANKTCAPCACPAACRMAWGKSERVMRTSRHVTAWPCRIPQASSALSAGCVTWRLVSLEASCNFSGAGGGGDGELRARDGRARRRLCG